MQDVLERMFARWARIEDRAAYARRALYNARSSRWRKAYIQRELPVAALPEVAVEGANASHQESRVAALQYLLSLPRQQRAVLALRYVEDMPDDKIADILDISVLTVKSHSTKALSSLRKSLNLVAPHQLAEEERKAQDARRPAG